MIYVRTLGLSLLTLLTTFWLVFNVKRVERYVGFVDLFNGAVAPGPSAFDARLHPEKHTQRAATTLEFDWIIQNELRSPDGIKKFIYTVNGLFPGPTIEARSGDRIILRVYNELEEESTAIHFHGIRQIGSNSMDGTPGLTQCSIPPNNSFVYNFTIEDNQSGTYWWHSHSLSQRADGLFGAFVIHDIISPKQNSENSYPDRIKEDLRIRKTRIKRGDYVANHAPFSERIALVGDWYHSSSSVMLNWYRSKKSFGNEPSPEGSLFNGENIFNCSRANQYVDCDSIGGHKPSLSLDLYSKTRLRLVNTGSLADLRLSLDFHTFVVIEADGSPVAPREVNSITISPGQRYSVVLQPRLPNKPRAGDSFWLRLTMDEQCFKMPNLYLDPDQSFLVFYGQSPKISTLATSDSLGPHKSLEDFDVLSLRPLHVSPLPPADQQLMVYVNSAKLDELGGIPYGYVNRTSWAPDEHEPLLLRSVEYNSSTNWGRKQLVVTTDRKVPSVVELIINNIDDGPHPFHLHGHHFYPLHVHQSTYGWGMYNFSSPPRFPDEAPLMRDTMVVPQRGHAVIRFLADAPGMWLFHCHMIVHLGTGMAMTFNVMPDIVSSHDKQIARESCRMHT